MLTKRRQRLPTGISSAVAICVALGSLVVTSCDRPSASDSTTASSSASTNDAALTGAVLQADPNPVPPGDPKGKTTITWDTGSDTVGDVYVITAGREKLFASGRQGSQEAPWIVAGPNEFRLYDQADHKLLAHLTVTMSSPNASARQPPASSTP
jgi:hypothetical protein